MISYHLTNSMIHLRLLQKNKKKIKKWAVNYLAVCIIDWTKLFRKSRNFDELLWSTQTYRHTHTFWEFVDILTKCVSKMSWPNVACKFGVFYHKKQNAEFYQYSVPQKSNFYRRWQLLKKLYRICTNNYDCNEYSAINTLDFLPNDIIWCL